MAIKIVIFTHYRLAKKRSHQIGSNFICFNVIYIFLLFFIT